MAEEETSIETTGDTEQAQQETVKDFSAQLLKDPGFLAAVQKNMDNMVGLSSGYIENLPKAVKRRIRALKKLQHKMHMIEGTFHEELHELECRLAKNLEPLREQRFNILNGNVEPTDSDCDWPTDQEEEEEEEEEEESKDKEKENKEEEEKNITGVPTFWLTIFKNVPLLNEMLQEHDEPILESLTDIRVVMRDLSNPGFTLEFVFAENEYFTNKVLTKDYTLCIKPDDKDSLVYEGAEIVACKGCEIDWKKDKNATVKVVRKTQKHKSHGSRRTVTKTVKRDSFFNFFDPPKHTEGEDEANEEETDMLLASDYEVGHFIRERLIPRAVLYFTGEALEEDGDDEDYEDEEKEEDYDEENDSDYEMKV
ncbi:DgyrCDS14227 [Dimorphilus gyrociliatus]|uniref:DgyrCDS14227 n=1 Tax=Dimorphilus gyrociliatus TaxID=2664684 RepID=A0A7I8WD12_9ANNE|nr:DgyrCDS14227 [Dimorphilus gyrociliatus]